MLIDTHCHLQSENYDNNKKIIEDSFKNNVSIMIINGYDLKNNIEAIELANEYDNVYAAIGYGPSVASDITGDDLIILEEQLKQSKVIAIGEIGLDYYWNKENKECQKSIFRKQIELAKKYNKPVIVHNREATNDVYTILKEEDISSTGGILHCFNASVEMAHEFIKLNMLIGVGGVITFKNTKLDEVIKNISMEYIVLETDSPYLTPEPYRGAKNEPKYISFIAQKIAELVNKDYNYVIERTSKNALALFDLKFKI